jgi:hypothetical protein
MSVNVTVIEEVQDINIEVSKQEVEINISIDQVATATAVQASIEAKEARDEAEISATNALISAQSALASEQSALLSEQESNQAKENAELASVEAENARDTAIDARDEALNAKDDAIQSKDDVILLASQVEENATLAEQAKELAIEAKDQAVEAKDEAVEAKDDALISEQNALTSEQNALISEQEANQSKLDAESARDEIQGKIDFTGLQDKDLLQFDSVQNKLIKVNIENVLKQKNAFNLSVVTPLHNRYNLLKFWGNPSAPLSGQIPLTNTTDNIQNLFNISGNSTGAFDFVRIDGNVISQVSSSNLENARRFSLAIDNSNYIDFFIRRNSIAVQETINDIKTLTQEINIPNITGLTTFEGQLLPIIITFSRGSRNISFQILNGLVSISPTRPKFNFNLFNMVGFGNDFFDIKITTNRWIAITGQEIL